jgi:hypothetical protein
MTTMVTCGAGASHGHFAGDFDARTPGPSKLAMDQCVATGSNRRAGSMRARTSSLVLVLVFVVAPLLSGCTLLGAGIGASRSTYTYQDVTGVPGRPDRNEMVEIVSQWGATRGRFEGVVKIEACEAPPGTAETCPSYRIALYTEGERLLIPAEDVRKVRVRNEDGNNALQGAAIGAAVDLFLFVLYTYCGTNNCAPHLFGGM